MRKGFKSITVREKTWKWLNDFVEKTDKDYLKSAASVIAYLIEFYEKNHKTVLTEM